MLTSEDKKAILKDFMDWSGGFTPDETDWDDDVSPYITHRLDASKFKRKDVRQWLHDVVYGNTPLDESKENFAERYVSVYKIQEGSNLINRLYKDRMKYMSKTNDEWELMSKAKKRQALIADIQDHLEDDELAEFNKNKQEIADGVLKKLGY